MKTQPVPPSVLLFAATVHILEDVSPLLDPTSDLFLEVKKWGLHRPLSEHPDFNQSPLIAQYAQVVLLAGLTLYGGVLVPSLKHVSIKDKEISLTWEGGIKDKLTLGVFDTSFQKFLKFYQRYVLKTKTPVSEVTLGFLEQVMTQLGREQLALELCSQSIQKILLGQSQTLEIITGEFRSDFLFLFISSLPSHALNALFLYLYPFFPEGLVIKTAQGHDVQVTSLFQTPSMNDQTLLEKANLYYQLYLSPELPIIRIITQSKTKEFLKELLQNTVVYQALSQQLKSIDESQLQTRLRVYQCLGKQFNLLICR